MTPYDNTLGGKSVINKAKRSPQSTASVGVTFVLCTETILPQAESNLYPWYAVEAERVAC